MAAQTQHPVTGWSSAQPVDYHQRESNQAMPALPPGLNQWLTPAVSVAVVGLLINQLVNQLGKRIDDLREDQRKTRKDVKELRDDVKGLPLKIDHGDAAQSTPLTPARPYTSLPGTARHYRDLPLSISQPRASPMPAIPQTLMIVAAVVGALAAWAAVSSSPS